MSRNPFVVDLAACRDAHKRMAGLPTRRQSEMSEAHAEQVALMDDDAPGPPPDVTIPVFTSKPRSKTRERRPALKTKIERGVPLPPHPRQRGTTKYSFLLEMQVGDSVVVQPSAAEPVMCTGRVLGKRTGMKFAIRTRVENGQKVCRIWRIA